MSAEVQNNIVELARQLYPSGRAFKMANESYLHKLHRALAVTQAQAYEDLVNILYAMLPDNETFSSDDATDWERRLAIATNLLTSLADRKLAIKRKMAAPGTQPAKGHYLYLQTQLRLAGFDVYVHENMIPTYPSGFDTYNPAVLNPAILTANQHGNGLQHGLQSHRINKVIVNSIDNDTDIYFNVGNTLRCTFFIGGQTLGTYATVSSSREVEFRQLVLKLKHAHLIAYLFINFS